MVRTARLCQLGIFAADAAVFVSSLFFFSRGPVRPSQTLILVGAVFLVGLSVLWAWQTRLDPWWAAGWRNRLAVATSAVTAVAYLVVAFYSFSKRGPNPAVLKTCLDLTIHHPAACDRFDRASGDLFRGLARAFMFAVPVALAANLGRGVRFGRLSAEGS